MKITNAFVSTVAVLGLSVGAHSAPQVPAASPNTGSSPSAQNHAPTFVRVKDGGTKLLNLADKNAEVVLKAGAGTLLQVHGTTAGYLEVSAPGGVEVWVFGEYAKPADEPGMLEISANSVQMRPLPASNEKSWALAQRLMKGEHVRYVGRSDPKKPWAEDWIKIASPASAHAWVVAADTTPLAAGENGATLWDGAERQALASAQIVEVPREGANSAASKTAAKPADATGKATPASAPTAGGDAITQADKLMEAARKSEQPDFAPARAAYQRVLDASPTGANAELARARLQEIGYREEIEKLKTDARASEAKRTEDIARKTDELREASLYQDPLWGRFQARGWLENDGERYVVRWANRLTSEIRCSQKRYDLDSFLGFEIGVTGTTVKSAVAGSTPGDARPAVIDAVRIEVLSGAGLKN